MAGALAPARLSRPLASEFITLGTVNLWSSASSGSIVLNKETRKEDIHYFSEPTLPNAAVITNNHGNCLSV